ncbi:uncharacterized protein LOC129592873 [Paramacrobiotus metropolitanus]|uniref:uncharacterized protein LOC129592873 n=1 Tax=Paramacrobiotus metropolitanus TaxID=2943436 RepID=UPI002445BC75|nr:uncharacterized protein LOC129592873 [Paramacrobiotus metropolitanus]
MDIRWLSLPDFLSDQAVVAICLSPEYISSGANLVLPWFSNASMILADWIMVVFSWERLLVILSPFRYGFLQRVVTARIIIVALVIFSLASYMYEFAANYDFIERPEWLSEWAEQNQVALIAARILTFLLILIPSIILIIILARHQKSEFSKMRRSQKASIAASASTHGAPMPTDRSLSQHATNIILLSSALLHLITRTPKFFDLCAWAIPGDSRILCHGS